MCVMLSIRPQPRIRATRINRMCCANKRFAAPEQKAATIVAAAYLPLQESACGHHCLHLEKLTTALVSARQSSQQDTSDTANYTNTWHHWPRALWHIVYLMILNASLRCMAAAI